MVYNMMDSFITISFPVYNDIYEENRLVSNELVCYIFGQKMNTFGRAYVLKKNYLPVYNNI